MLINFNAIMLSYTLITSKYLISKAINCAEHEYMKMSPTIFEFAMSSITIL